MNEYRSNFDTLGNRIADGLTSETYALELLDALIFAAVIALPFVIFFWSM